MPHKKNPDVFELTRAKCNKLQALPVEITLITSNLPSGYFRDLQLIKENFLPAFDEIESILAMVTRMVEGMKVNTHIADDDRYKMMYSVEIVNKLVLNGTPFRDAYLKVGRDIEHGDFVPEKDINHTHPGSIGNLCTDRIHALMERTIAEFNFDAYHKAFDTLINGKDI